MVSLCSMASLWPATLHVSDDIWDLTGTIGFAFYWWGADNPPEALNQIRLETPTGFWSSDFYDGFARWRYVLIPWGGFTWVSNPQRRLEPHRHGFDEPVKDQILGFLWTMHTSGLRRLDYVHAPRQLKGAKGIFTARHSQIQEELGAFIVRQSASQNLGAGFIVRQDFKDLAAEFYVEMITTYAVEGTGDITCPHEVETVLEGMTQTITGMKSGDIVILNFDCTLLETGIEKGSIIFRIKVDGVQIGKITRRDSAAIPGGILQVPISFMRRYVVPGDGDYTFTVTWYWSDPFGTPTYPPEIDDGERTLTIMHIS